MWHFSMQGLPAMNVAIQSRELLPHVFTLISPRRDGNFLWHCLFPPKQDLAIHQCIALCCPDFPPSSMMKAITQPAAGAKIRNEVKVETKVKIKIEMRMSKKEKSGFFLSLNLNLNLSLCLSLNLILTKN